MIGPAGPGGVAEPAEPAVSVEPVEPVEVVGEGVGVVVVGRGAAAMLAVVGVVVTEGLVEGEVLTGGSVTAVETCGSGRDALAAPGRAARAGTDW
jgi:hypothetical protein